MFFFQKYFGLSFRLRQKIILSETCSNMLEHVRTAYQKKNDSFSIRYKTKRFSFWDHILLAVEFRVYSMLYRCICVCILNGKMNFARGWSDGRRNKWSTWRNKLLIWRNVWPGNVRWRLCSVKCFDSDMENNDKVIYRNLNRAQVNVLNPVKKMCCIEFYYTGHERYCFILLNMDCRNKRSIFKFSCRSNTWYQHMYNSRRIFLFGM